MRLFCAIALDRPHRSALARLQDTLRRAGVTGRWTEPEQLHLTLAFLGEQPDARRAAAALEETEGRAFPLAFGGLGRFVRRGGDVLYLAVPPRPALLGLQRSLTEALLRQGIGLEARPYRPHITLARRAGAVPEGFEAPVLEEMTVRAFVLMESRLGAEGARYLPLLERRLG